MDDTKLKYKEMKELLRKVYQSGWNSGYQAAKRKYNPKEGILAEDENPQLPLHLKQE